ILRAALASPPCMRLTALSYSPSCCALLASSSACLCCSSGVCIFLARPNEPVLVCSSRDDFLASSTPRSSDHSDCGVPTELLLQFIAGAAAGCSGLGLA